MPHISVSNVDIDKLDVPIHNLPLMVIQLMNDPKVITFVSVIILKIVVVLTILVIISFVCLTVDDNRRQRLWNRLKKLRDMKRNKKITKSHNNNKNVHENNLSNNPTRHRNSESKEENELHQLISHRYRRQQQQQSITMKEDLNIISKEVQEWKGIQKDVRVQLHVLNKKVQQLQHEKQHDQLPSLTKLD